MKEMPSAKHFPPFLAAELPGNRDDALFHILPIPLGRGACARELERGPSSLLRASTRLEVFDGRGIPAEAGIFTHPPVDCRGRTEDVLNRIADRTEEIFLEERIPVLLGGDRGLSCGAFLAVLRRMEGGAEGVGILQIDAHANLKENGPDGFYSAASTMKRALEMGFPLYQVGVRSLSPGETDLRKEHDIPYRDAADLCSGAGVKEISLSPDFPEFLYLTIDLDALDPGVIPGTPLPEPGGLFWYQILGLIESLAERHRIVGFDITGLAPGEGDRISPYAAAQLAYRIMGILARYGETAAE